MRKTAGYRAAGGRRAAWRLWWLGILAAATLGVTGHAEPSGLVRPDRGWTVTMYYTAVESYHHGPTERVIGCLRLDCERGTADLGTYPADFLQAVREEGAGRLTSGEHAGEYLSWSYDVGYWLDDVPRDATGRPLVPFASAAADADVAGAGTSFRIDSCGTETNGSAIDLETCDRLRAARWRIVDGFTPGFGGPRHIDAYIGEESGVDFTDGPSYATLSGARLTWE